MGEGLTAQFLKLIELNIQNKSPTFRWSAWANLRQPVRGDPWRPAASYPGWIFRRWRSPRLRVSTRSGRPENPVSPGNSRKRFFLKCQQVVQSHCLKKSFIRFSEESLLIDVLAPPHGAPTLTKNVCSSKKMEILGKGGAPLRICYFVSK